MPASMSKRQFVLGSVSAAALLLPAGGVALAAVARHPNIVFIYADDLGYGDIGCYGATRVRTPNLDRLAAQGARFTNGHAPAATCTPSRYAFLTGDYAWRQDGAHILPGDAPALIRPGKYTLPTMLKQAGYTTGLVGKWHLGLGTGHLDWNGSITPGPLEIGFDYGYYIPATIDRVPCIYIENHAVVGLDPRDPISVDYRQKVGTDPTGKENPDLLRMTPSEGHDGTIVDGVSRIGWMSGGSSARWSDEDMADRLTGKAVSFIEANRDKPFFLYFATNEIHVPRLPAKRFQGASGMGPRGDSIVELDWIVGEVTAALERLGLAENTLVVFSSDNGPVLDDGYQDQAVEKNGAHRPAGPFRSGKYSIYDGGLKVPLIVRWPGTVKAGTTSDALIDHADMLASFAALVNQPLPANAALDSHNVLPALLARSDTGRAFVIEEASTVVAEKSTLAKNAGGSILALVMGDWKAIAPHEGATTYHGNALGAAPMPQLYDLRRDPGETQNVAARYPDRTKAMLAQLEQYRASGRSRPA